MTESFNDKIIEEIEESIFAHQPSLCESMARQKGTENTEKID